MSLDTKEIHVTERTVNRPPSLPMSQKPLSQDARQGGVPQTGQIWGHGLWTLGLESEALHLASWAPGSQADLRGKHKLEPSRMVRTHTGLLLQQESPQSQAGPNSLQALPSPPFPSREQDTGTPCSEPLHIN